MITHVHVKNFKCLQDVQAEFQPFTVLIGQNDSGKSSLLEAIQVLGKLANPREQSSMLDKLGEFVWQRDDSLEIGWYIKGKVDDKEFVYNLALKTNAVPSQESLILDGKTIVSVTGGRNASLASGGRPVQMPIQQGTGLASLLQHGPMAEASKEASKVAALLVSTIPYRLDPTSLRLPAKLERGAVLTPRGENLVAVLDGIFNATDRRLREEVEVAFEAAVPTLHGIGLPTIEKGNSNQKGNKGLEVGLSGSSGAAIPSELASDGALRFLAFEAIAYGGGPEVIFIEEPENGLHYSRLRMVVEILRKITTGEVGGRARQVIITTHSPALLNLVKPEEVLVVRRPEGRGTQVTRMDQMPNVANLSKEFGPGELWFLLGEEGLAKEVQEDDAVRETAP